MAQWSRMLTALAEDVTVTSTSVCVHMVHIRPFGYMCIRMNLKILKTQKTSTNPISSVSHLTSHPVAALQHHEAYHRPTTVSSTHCDF